MIAVSLRPANAGFQSTLPTRGSDYRGKAASILNDPISIHAPHEGERPQQTKILIKLSVFQSTLPTRGSDVSYSLMLAPIWISIHAPHEGERPRAITPAVAIKTFQSTLPTRGSDAMPDCVWRAGALFQSTLPTRGSDSGKVHLYAAFPRIC